MNSNTWERLEKMLKEYSETPPREKQSRSIGMFQRTWLGIDIIAEIYSQIYSRRIGIPKRVTKGEALDIAVEETIRDTIAELKKAAEE